MGLKVGDGVDYSLEIVDILVGHHIYTPLCPPGNFLLVFFNVIYLLSLGFADNFVEFECFFCINLPFSVNMLLLLIASGLHKRFVHIRDGTADSGTFYSLVCY